MGLWGRRARRRRLEECESITFVVFAAAGTAAEFSIAYCVDDFAGGGGDRGGVRRGGGCAQSAAVSRCGIYHGGGDCAQVWGGGVADSGDDAEHTVFGCDVELYAAGDAAGVSGFEV